MHVRTVRPQPREGNRVTLGHLLHPRPNKNNLWNLMECETLIKSDGGTDWDIRVGFVANVYGTAGQRVRDVNSASGVINDTLQ